MNLLYISSNDGTDTRIVKEIKSLCEDFNIIFVGISTTSENFIKDYCDEYYVIPGKRKNPITILRQFLLVLYLLLFRKINSVHIINEQLMIFFYPLLFFKYTVLDLFDSIFFKKNLIGNKGNLLKRIIYAPVDKIIVTDHNRLSLMPDFLKNKCVVIPNYPNKILVNKRKIRSNKLTILYTGWLGFNRGSEIIEGLLKTGLPLHIISAGWFSDSKTEELVKKFPQYIEYKGVLPQSTVLDICSEKADYILCVYSPINQNNINASPNKIYDAIQVKTPIIINSEIKISEFVKNNNLGMVIPSYNVSDFKALYLSLMERREKYSWDSSLSDKYSWEKLSRRLIMLHKQNNNIEGNETNYTIL